MLVPPSICLLSTRWVPGTGTGLLGMKLNEVWVFFLGAYSIGEMMGWAIPSKGNGSNAGWTMMLDI